MKALSPMMTLDSIYPVATWRTHVGNNDSYLYMKDDDRTRTCQGANKCEGLYTHPHPYSFKNTIIDVLTWEATKLFSTTFSNRKEKS